MIVAVVSMLVYLPPMIVAVVSMLTTDDRGR
ncbi:hypothetical protein AVEN_75647-1, partial [Araneus ventricosus]